MQFKVDKSNWKKVRLGDVATEYSKRCNNPSESGFERFIGSSNINQWDFRINSWESTDSVTSAMKLFEPNDYLLVRRSLYASDFRERAPRANFAGVCSGDILTIRENPKMIADGFLIGILNSPALWKYVVANASGSITRRIKWRDLANYEFLLPPKEQQAELAELLWAMDEVIEKDLAVLERLEIAFKVNANQSLNIGYADDFISLPKGWKVNKLKEIAKVNSGSTPLRANKDFFENGTVPWVKTLDLNNGVISSTEESITELALSKTSCKKRSVGTVLVAMYGGFNQIGRTGILEIEAATNQAISAIDLNRELIRPKYLLYVLNSRIDYWKKVAVSSRKDPNITKADVENFPVVYPSLDTQDAIIAEIDLMKVSNAKIESKIAASKALQKSLINEIF